MWEDCRGDEWTPWVDLFLPLKHNRYGHFVQLPFAGGYADQPAATMSALRVIQAEYYQYLEEVNRRG